MNNALEIDSDKPNYILYNEDCLLTTKRIADGVVNLVYADPPFFTGRNYEKGQFGFTDKWTDISEYVTWITPRVKEFRRILTDDGMIYVHCDWHASHYIKVLADEIFGQKNFLNEIIWKRQGSHNDAGQGGRHFGRVHDTILVYSKSRNYVWNQQFTAYSEEHLKRAYRFVEPNTGRRYAAGDLLGPGGASKRNPRYEFLGRNSYWRFNQQKMRRLLAHGKIHHVKGGTPYLKRYLDEMRGRPLQDLWTDVESVSHSKQDFGFPTQKPEELIRRIICTSTNPNGFVYDAFVGSGSCAAVSLKQSRRWIGSEISRPACRVILNRMAALNCKVDFRSSSNAEEVPKSPTSICKRLSQRTA